MRNSALEFLACPKCRGHLIADTEPPAPDGHIMQGVLACGCGTRYQIRRGIPRLFADPQQEEARNQQLPSPFGARWSLESVFAQYEQQFLDWVSPLEPRDFTNRTILQVGCRAGGHTPILARYGARAVVGVEPSADVELAFAATRHLTNAHIVQGEISELPVTRAFEVALSVSAISHLVEPRPGFHAMADRVVAGGRIAMWTPSYEDKEWLVRYLDPIRREVTAKLPRQLVYWASLGPALALSATLQLCRIRSIADQLPQGTYLHYISWYPLRKVHHIVFDQLTNPVMHYLREEEIRTWFEEPDFSEVKISWHKNASWRASAVVTGHANEDKESRRGLG